MNESILRGFCQKCNRPQIFGETTNHNTGGGVWEDCEPVWFLSPQQMKKIYFSQEFANWRNMHQQKEIWDFLIHSPFLVAKILSEAKE